jgi:spore coat protein U-like protein
MTKTRIALLAGVAFTAFGSPLLAQAVTVTQNMGVNLTVTAQCILSPVSSIALTGSLLSGNLDGAGSLSLQCTSGTAYKVRMGLGAGTGAALTARKLTSGTNTVNYNLFTDAARTLVWSDLVAGPNQISGTGTGTAATIPVYVRIPSQVAAPGTYTDTVVVSVDY